MTYAIVRLRRPAHCRLDDFARRTGLHPDVVRRLIALGLLDAVKDAGGEYWLPVSQLAVAARIQRLRADFSINYAGLGLVMDLLDRISELETALREHPPYPSRTRGG
jgi:hypothetical protein